MNIAGTFRSWFHRREELTPRERLRNLGPLPYMDPRDDVRLDPYDTRNRRSTDIIGTGLTDYGGQGVGFGDGFGGDGGGTD